ncbi:tRNA lysidine(34) synthetase TilS [Flavobacterium sp.]|uniref:tRNA lysidine(34) synthetase TilS n=1 Tax=Flavobacterium sp. TaxID=239 RepID=UPI0026225BD2|nr:tRNA lysidine(34) synthetase TilS [Flavobacterium sp.]
MLEKLRNHLNENLPFLKDKKLLLAVSGGIDSMVMVDLFHKLHYKIAIAHCNFQLRGAESFGDEQFVVDYADKNKIPVFTTKFDTKAFAEDYKLSIQLAARDLRYHWFYELLETEHYDYILTAHHADDNLETFLINLSRGTGLEGLTGIPEQNDKIIRPLLAFNRTAIETYADEDKINWREDSSNASDKYLRNKIRHDLVPLFKDLNANFIDSFQKTQSYLQQSQAMAEDAAVMVYQQVASEQGDEIHFDLKKLTQLPNYTSYLYHWLNEFGFTAWDDIYALADAQSGKQVFSKDYRLLKDRGVLIVAPISNEIENLEFTIDKNVQDVNFPLKLSFCKVADTAHISNSVIFVDEEKLQFPLLLRKWKSGDAFQPSGMQGQSKKLSKFFKDEKFSLFEKENSWLLCSGNEIVWVVGFRHDERFKADAHTKKILKIEVKP